MAVSIVFGPLCCYFAIPSKPDSTTKHRQQPLTVHSPSGPTLSVHSNVSNAGPKIARWSGVINSARVMGGGRSICFGKDGGGGGVGRGGGGQGGEHVAPLAFSSLILGCVSTGSDLMFELSIAVRLQAEVI